MHNVHLDAVFLMPILFMCNVGAYDDEEAAARAYDLAALKYWGAGTQINFPVSHFFHFSQTHINVCYFQGYKYRA